jgi:hypothetical protein
MGLLRSLSSGLGLSPRKTTIFGASSSLASAPEPEAEMAVGSEQSQASAERGPEQGLEAQIPEPEPEPEPEPQPEPEPEPAFDPVESDLQLNRMGGVGPEYPMSPRSPGAEVLRALFAHIAKEKWRVVEIFFGCDTDGSASLDLFEFEEAIKLMRFGHPMENAIKLAFHELDADSSGDIEISEFMTRMHIERRYRKTVAELGEQRRATMAKMARQDLNLQLLDGVDQAAAIQEAGEELWSSAVTNVVNLWKSGTGKQLGRNLDDDEWNMHKEEADARLAELEAIKHLQQAEEARASMDAEQAEAEAAEAALAKEEREAHEALDNARREEYEADKAMKKAELEQRFANKMEETARQTMQQAEDRKAMYEQEKTEADQARANVAEMKLKLLHGQEELDAADVVWQQAKVKLAEAASMEWAAAGTSAAKKASAKWRTNDEAEYLAEEDVTEIRRAAHFNVESSKKAHHEAGERLKVMKHDLLQAEADAEREAREADESWEVFQKQLAEAKDMIPLAKQRRATALEAEEIAKKEKLEAIEARAIAEKEMGEANAARSLAEAERAQADEAKAKAEELQGEADRAIAVAVKERANANEARLKYARKRAVGFGKFWRKKARAMAQAREDNIIKARRRAATRATNRQVVGSVIEEMIAPVGKSLATFDKSLKRVQNTLLVGDADAGDIAERAQKLRELRQQYHAQLRPQLALPPTAAPFAPTVPWNTRTMEPSRGFRVNTPPNNGLQSSPRRANSTGRLAALQKQKQKRPSTTPRGASAPRHGLSLSPRTTPPRPLTASEGAVRHLSGSHSKRLNHTTMVGPRSADWDVVRRGMPLSPKLQPVTAMAFAAKARPTGWSVPTTSTVGLPQPPPPPSQPALAPEMVPGVSLPSPPASPARGASLLRSPRSERVHVQLREHSSAISGSGVMMLEASLLRALESA